MKKLIALTIAVIMVFALAACGGGGETDAPETPAPDPAPSPNPTPAPQEPDGDFFPGLSNDEIPEILMRKAGQVESAVKEPSGDPDYTSEITIVLAGCPMHFYSILSDHYNGGAISSELPLEEDQMRFYTFDWGIIELSNKELLINDGKIKIVAKVY